MPAKRPAHRPRIFKDPIPLTLRVERTDRANWQKQAETQGQSLNQWMIEAAKKQAENTEDRRAPQTQD